MLLEFKQKTLVLNESSSTKGRAFLCQTIKYSVDFFARVE